MKNCFHSLLLALLLLGGTATARERLYINTDRPAYLAGERVYCSLFSVDEKGRKSNFSAVSYVELISAQGTAAEAKIGLFMGRGAGSFLLPEGLPTGNYALAAYTAGGVPAPEGIRRIAVYNPVTSARVPGGVTIEPEWTPALTGEKPSELLQISVTGAPSPGKNVSLLLFSQEAVDLTVSVYHDDGLVSPDGASLAHFLHGPATPAGHATEYEGEIIYASVEGLEEGTVMEAESVTAYLSTAGAPSQVYVGRNNADGQIQFFTGNIYGDRELVCEVVAMSGKHAHINLKSPFTHPEVGAIEPLALSPGQREALVARKASLSAEFDAPLDTLLEFLPKREDLLLEDAQRERIHLDDYTRFNTVKEICVELLPSLQFTRSKGKYVIKMVTSDPTESRKYTLDNILVMMDGVVLTDHGMLADFDAMLLEDIDIYRQSVALGGVPFNGVVNFITKKNYVTALNFPDNVRVIDFKGVSYPVAYTGIVPNAKTDLRQLLFFHPALTVKGQSAERLTLTLPSYTGVFRVKAEGWTASGTPVHAEYTFEVR